MKRTLLFAIAMLAAAAAHAQPQRVVKFGATTTTGTSSVVPELTWCTDTLNPGEDVAQACVSVVKAAASCTATGPANWAGTKAAAGTATLPAITANTTYGLSCSWPDDTSITVQWTNPTENTNGTPLTDLDRVVFAFRQGAGTITTACQPPVRCENVKPPISPKTFDNFALGTWRIVGWAVNAGGTFSPATAEVSKVNLAAAAIARDVTITVAGQPNTITGVQAQ